MPKKASILGENDPRMEIIGSMPVPKPDIMDTIIGWKPQIPCQEARAFPLPPPRWLLKHGLLSVQWDKVKDGMIPIANEIKSGAKETGDSAKAYMHRATTTPEWLIEEAVANYLRKINK